MWGRPFAQVVVRPQRYTFEFMEKYPTFTLCGFPPDFRPDLQLLGSLSGRDTEKSIQAHLTPTARPESGCAGFCRGDPGYRMQKDVLAGYGPRQFYRPNLDKNYPRQDYHRIYYGEIVAVFGDSAYLRSNP